MPLLCLSLDVSFVTAGGTSSAYNATNNEDCDIAIRQGRLIEAINRSRFELEPLVGGSQ
jgi:hypothetical protein